MCYWNLIGSYDLSYWHAEYIGQITEPLSLSLILLNATKIKLSAVEDGHSPSPSRWTISTRRSPYARDERKWWSDAVPFIAQSNEDLLIHKLYAAQCLCCCFWFCEIIVARVPTKYEKNRDETKKKLCKTQMVCRWCGGWRCHSNPWSDGFYARETVHACTYICRLRSIMSSLRRGSSQDVCKYCWVNLEDD